MDVAKVRAYLRKMPHQDIFAMLDEAVGLSPKAKLLVRRYVSPERVQKAGEEAIVGTERELIPRHRLGQQVAAHGSRHGPGTGDAKDPTWAPLSDLDGRRNIELGAATVVTAIL